MHGIELCSNDGFQTWLWFESIGLHRVNFHIQSDSFHTLFYQAVEGHTYPYCEHTTQISPEVGPSETSEIDHTPGLSTETRQAPRSFR